MVDVLVVQWFRGRVRIQVDASVLSLVATFHFRLWVLQSLHSLHFRLSVLQTRYFYFTVSNGFSTMCSLQYEVILGGIFAEVACILHNAV